MRRTIAAAALLSLSAAALPVYAEEHPAPVAAAAASAIVVPARVERALSRPAALPVLYASYAALQAYDVYSTRQALGRGAREANPLMQHVVGSQSAFWAIKASATVGTIAAAERLWKKDKKGAAIAVLVASNAVAALVAARNANTLRR